MDSLVTSSAQINGSGINLSVNLESYTNDTATREVLASSPFDGTTSFTLTTPITGAFTGVRATAYSDLYYYRIWIIPRTTNLGNVIANQMRTIEVWNAAINPIDLSAITVVGDNSGISLSGLPSGTYNALHSEVYTLTALIAGSPTIDFHYLFDFETIYLLPAYVVGRRVLPFPLRHNWIDPVLEQIAFKTDILTGESGKEQRISLRTEPRRRIEMSYITMDANERSYFENLMYGWQARTFAVPLWFDSSRLTAPVAINDQTFAVDTVNRDYDVGSFIYISSGSNYDILEIESLDATTINTVTGSNHTYPDGVKVCPAKLALIESKQSKDRHTSIAEIFRIAWNMQPQVASTNRRESYTPVTYRGLEVLNISNDYSSAIPIDQELVETINDNDIGLTTKTGGEPNPRLSYPFKQLIERPELGRFLQWFYNRQGRLKPFWFVERVPAFEIAVDATAPSSQLIVKYTGYSSLIAEAVPRRDIAIRKPDGTYIYRRITASEDNLDGTETLTLDATNGVALNVDDKILISYIKCVRLAQDQVELSYETNAAVRTATSFTDLLTNS